MQPSLPDPTEHGRRLVARDARSFCFSSEDSLESLRAAGWRLVRRARGGVESVEPLRSGFTTPDGFTTELWGRPYGSTTCESYRGALFNTIQLSDSLYDCTGYSVSPRTLCIAIGTALPLRSGLTLSCVLARYRSRVASHARASGSRRRSGRRGAPACARTDLGRDGFTPYSILYLKLYLYALYSFR